VCDLLALLLVAAFTSNRISWIYHKLRVLLSVNNGTVMLSPSSNIPLVQGAIYSHVAGSAGFPAIGAK
jgi:hypothetical protein